MKISSKFGLILCLYTTLFLTNCSKDENGTELQKTKTSTNLGNENETVAQDNNNQTNTDQKTFVPDDEFERFLIEKGYDDVKDDYVLTENISSVEEIKLQNINYLVSDLTGLEDFASLKTLHLEGLPIETFDVSKYPKLIDLFFFNTDELSSLSISNTDLESLFFLNLSLDSLIVSRNTRLTSFGLEDGGPDYFLFDNNPKLEFLEMMDASVDTFIVTNNESLVTYFCNSCGHKDLTFSNNPNFKTFGRDFSDGFSIASLTFNNNPMLNKISIKDLEKLRSLDIKDNDITEIDISENTILEILDVTGNPLTCVQVSQEQLENIPSEWKKDTEDIYSLDCSKNTNLPKTFVPDDAFEQFLIDQGYDDTLDDYVLTENISLVEEIHISGSSYGITNLEGLQNFAALTSLSLEGLPITTFDASQYKKLVRLSLLNANELDQLSIVGTCIESLSFFRLFVSSLEVSNNHSLKSFDIEDGGFGTFVLDANPKLDFLTLIDIFSDSFTISNNQILQDYFCNSCGHREMKFINNENFEKFGGDIDDGLSIESLTFNDNPKLKRINVSDLPKLTKLNAKNNGLTEINVSQNNILSELNVSFNPLICIQVSISQKNDIPKTWLKDEEDVYSLDCQ